MEETKSDAIKSLEAWIKEMKDSGLSNDEMLDRVKAGEITTILEQIREENYGRKQRYYKMVPRAEECRQLQTGVQSPGEAVFICSALDCSRSTSVCQQFG